jgi:hypothetical protein
MRLLRGFRVESDATSGGDGEGARRRDGVVTRVRKVAAVSLMTPMAAAALAVGLNQQPADAAGCPPLASASINAPTGTVIAGSSVHATAKITGLMLLQAHLQISGPGLDKQVGNSVMSGEIKGDVVVPKPGYFTLAVVGNGTKCTYQTAGFSVKEKASAAKPTHSSAPSLTPRAGGRGSGSAAGAPSLPTGSVGNGAGANFGLNPLNGASPFSLPSVAPDGQGFQYPSPDPQVASPPSRPVARNVSETTPIKWGQSLAIALVLLIISAHLGMLSRRQRLAAEGPRSTGGGKLIGRKKSRKAAAVVAETSVLTDSATEAARPTDTAPAVGTPTTDGTASTDNVSAADRTPDAPTGTAAADSATPANSAEATDDVSTDEAQSRRSTGRTYRGRRRRG